MATPNQVPPLPEADEFYMSLALKEAQLAAAQGEVPVGCVLVDPSGEVIGTGHNLTISTHDPTAHAEVVALRDAGLRLGNYRLPNLQMFVTLEPCLMCVGAIIHSRLLRLCYGTADPRTGACGSVFSLINAKEHNHALIVCSGILQEECASLLHLFFKARRQKKADFPE